MAKHLRGIKNKRERVRRPAVCYGLSVHLLLSKKKRLL